MDKLAVPIKKSQDIAYQNHVRELILFRFRILCFLAIVIELQFNILDWVQYPHHAWLFLKIRIIADLVMLPFLIFSFFINKSNKFINWLPDISGAAVALSVAAMVFLVDKSSSGYYQGVNLVFLGRIFFDPYHTWHASWFFVFLLLIYEAIMLFPDILTHHFNFVNFVSANFFMLSTAFLMAISIKLYEDQHYEGYLRQQQLELSEKKLADMYGKADKLAKTDELTEIHNRRYFFELLKAKIRESEVSKNPFYLIIFDVDYFKNINDSYGHAFGDKVLVQVVGSVKNNIRPNDFLGRYGGDEFIICLDMANRDVVLARLTKISKDVHNLDLSCNDEKVFVSISMGGTKFLPDQNIHEEKLMEKADLTLLDVKKTARGHINLPD